MPFLPAARFPGARAPLLLLLLLGAWLRLAGWDRGTVIYPPDEPSGVPQQRFLHFHPDEQTLIDAAGRLASPFHPPLTAYGMLPLYAARAAMGAAGVLTGGHLDPDGQSAVLAVRLLSAALSVATLWLVWVVGRLAVGEVGALLGTAFVAGAPVAVQQAHFYTVDGLLAFLVAAVLWATLVALDRGRRWHYALAGALVGAAGAVRLSGLLLGALLAAGHVGVGGATGWPARLHRLRAERLWVAGGVAALVVLVLQPYMIADPGWFRHSESTDDLAYSMSIARGEVLHPWSLVDVHTVPYLRYWTHLLPQGAGWPLTVAVSVGLVWGVWRGGLAGRLLAAWCLAYFLLIGGLHTKHVRYLLPMLPGLSLLAGGACAWLIRRQRLLGTLAAATVTAGSLAYGVAFTRIYRADDSRIQAARWLAEQAAPQAAVGVESGGFTMGSCLPAGRLRVVPIEEGLIYGAQQYLSCRAAILHLQERVGGLDYLALVDANRYRQFTAVPELYPMLAAFYERLWAGQLGFTVEARFKEYPALAGIAWRDDEAEPSFLGYDHPAVLVFRRSSPAAVTAAFDAWRTGCERDARCPDALIGQTAAPVREGAWSSALQAAQRLVERHPEQYMGHYLLNWIHQGRGERGQAEAEVRLYLAGYASVASVCFVPWASGMTLLAAGLPDLVPVCLQQGRSLAPQLTQTEQRYLGQSYLRLAGTLVNAGERTVAHQVLALAEQICPAISDQVAQIRAELGAPSAPAGALGGSPRRHIPGPTGGPQ
ncbi:MAG: glycosyltransferase family 39 protein [Candidatus Latescibacterota bacterium]